MPANLSLHELTRASAAAVGGLAAGETVVPDDDNLSSNRKRVPPSERVGFGIVGVGMQGSGMIEGSLAPGVAE